MGEPCLPQGGQLTPGVLEHPEVDVPGGQLRRGVSRRRGRRRADGGGPDLADGHQAGCAYVRRGQRVRHQCVALDRPLDRDEGPAGCRTSQLDEPPEAIAQARSLEVAVQDDHIQAAAPAEDSPIATCLPSTSAGALEAHEVGNRPEQCVGDGLPRRPARHRPQEHPRRQADDQTEEQARADREQRGSPGQQGRGHAGRDHQDAERQQAAALTDPGHHQKGDRAGEQDAERVRQPTAGQSHRQGEVQLSEAVDMFDRRVQRDHGERREHGAGHRVEQLPPRVPEQEVEAHRDRQRQEAEAGDQVEQEEHDRGHERDGLGHVGLDAGRRAVGEGAEQQESRQGDERRKETQHVRRAPDPVGQRRLDDLDPSVLLHGHTGDRVMPRRPCTSGCAGAVRTARLRRPGARPGRPGPVGQVVTYGDLAGMVGSGSGRTTGRVMALYGGAVPWWRVVLASGAPAPGHEREALRRLRAEGVPLRPDGPRVDLALRTAREKVRR